MKAKDLIKKLEAAGYWLSRHGGKHDIYTNGAENIPIPRHKEINERLARSILKKIIN